MSSVPGLPLHAAREWQEVFSEMVLLPPAVRRMVDHPGSTKPSAAQAAIFKRFALALPGEDPTDPWILSWRVEEKQPHVVLKEVAVYEWELRQRVIQAEGSKTGPMELARLRRDRDKYSTIIATRTHFLAVGETRGVADRFRTLRYVDCESVYVDENRLWARVDQGPALEIAWEPPGSGAAQLLYALAAGFGPDGPDRLVSAQVASEHGKALKESRATVKEVMTTFARHIERVAGAASTSYQSRGSDESVAAGPGRDTAPGSEPITVCPLHGLVEQPVPAARKLSGGKLLLGVMTYGVSLAATGVRKGGVTWKSTSEDRYCPVRGCGRKVEFR